MPILYRGHRHDAPIQRVQVTVSVRATRTVVRVLGFHPSNKNVPVRVNFLRLYATRVVPVDAAHSHGAQRLQNLMAWTVSSPTDYRTMRSTVCGP